MKLLTYLSAVTIACFTLNCCVDAPKEVSKNGISGVYRYQGMKGMTYEFRGDKCFGIRDGKQISESKFKVEGNLLYISPNIPDMKTMIRNVWVVWEIKGNKIISQYLVDVNDGTRFYEDQAGKIVFQKQKARPSRVVEDGKPPVAPQTPNHDPKPRPTYPEPVR